MLPRGVAVGPSPIGPFTIVSMYVPLLTNGSSIYFWVDSKQDAYVVLNNFAKSNTNLAVAKLTDNYTAVAAVGEYFGLPNAGVEGGGIFERNGVWYAMSGSGCCFCAAGANADVWTAANPLGPYTYVSDVIAYNSTSKMFVIPAQQFGVFPIATRRETTYLYVGIRFGSAPDNLKNHDFQYWAPLQFDSNNKIMPMNFLSSFKLDLVDDEQLLS